MQILALVLALKLAALFAFLYVRQRHITRIAFHERDGARFNYFSALEWLDKQAKEHAERRAQICAAITRRPPRRAWLQIARHVARLAS